MTDREKVIKGLECCNGILGCGGGCPYWLDKRGCSETLEADALALLKAQEPRVLTKEELPDASVIEYRSGKMKDVCSELMKDGNGDWYGTVWRVWTSRPDEKRRAETPWE